MIGFPPRSWTKPIWQWYYRQVRLVRRESEKVLTDMIIHGCGFYDEKGNHIPWAKVMIKPKETLR